MKTRTNVRRSQAARRLFSLGALVLLIACQKSLPTAPSDLTFGVVVYEHAGYQGASAHITTDIADLKNFKGPCVKTDSSGPPGSISSRDEWNDCISSIRVAPGWAARLYKDDGFDGDQLEVTADISNLTDVPGNCSKGGFNDCATAIKIFLR
jgi:hypothetical protein